MFEKLKKSLRVIFPKHTVSEVIDLTDFWKHNSKLIEADIFEMDFVMDTKRTFKRERLLDDSIDKLQNL